MKTSNIYKFNGVDPFDNWRVVNKELVGYYPRNSLVNLLSKQNGGYIDNGDSFVINEGVEVIGSSCFRNNERFKEIYLPQSIRLIKQYAIPREIVLVVHKGTYSEKYVLKHNFTYRYY